MESHSIGRLFLLCVMLVGPSSAVLAQAVDSVDADMAEAARTVTTEQEAIEQMREICTQVYPNEKLGLSTYAVLWLDQNREEILGVRSWKEKAHDTGQLDAYARKAAAQRLSNLKSLLDAQKRIVCLSNFTEVKAGQWNVAVRAARASADMKGYLAQHPLSKAGARAFDGPLGCLKRALNERGDIDRARPLCQCNWDVMSTTLTEKEWNSYEAAVEAKKPATEIAGMPPMRRAMPKLLACREKFPM